MKCLAKSVATMHFILCCGLAVFAASPQLRLEIYQNEIRNKDSGVYEVDEDLYAHVKLSIGRKESRMRVKQKAILEANELLKRWAIDYTAKDRNGKCTLSSGWQLAMAMLNYSEPMWRFSDWNMNIAGQEFTGKDGDMLWFVQIFQRDKLIQETPPSFSTPNPNKGKITDCLKHLAAECKKRNAIDLIPDSDEKVVAQKEQQEMGNRLTEYFNHSPFVAELKKRKGTIAASVVSEKWIEKEISTSSFCGDEVIVTTNRIYDVPATTNRVKRLQTEAERLNMGVAEGGVLNVDTFVSEVYEIITRDVTTTDVVRKAYRCKVVSTAVGVPRFEEMFLSLGQIEIGERKPTDVGKNAVAAYFGGTLSVLEKDVVVRDALCENPGDVFLWNVFGLSQLRHNDTLGALVCFYIAYKLNPIDQSVLTNLAIAYDKLNCRHLSYLYAALGLGVSTDGVCQKTCAQLLEK